ncbi:hypothetical protein [Roseibium alexandrii]|uniref:hypothetical protein n=1 Tax=Roseibium alexandrii TaxID=388408 RepID=UPI00375006A0
MTHPLQLHLPRGYPGLPARLQAKRMTRLPVTDRTALFRNPDGSGGHPEPGDTFAMALNPKSFRGRIAERFLAGLANLGAFDVSTAVNGVVGSGGAFPDGWSANASGITFTVTKGDGYVDIALSGTSSGSWNLIFKNGLDVSDEIYAHSKIGLAVSTGNVAGSVFSAMNFSTGGSGSNIAQISSGLSSERADFQLIAKPATGTTKANYSLFFQGAVTQNCTLRIYSGVFNQLPDAPWIAPSTEAALTLQQHPAGGVRNLHPYSGVTTLSSSGMLNPSNTNGVSSSLVGSGEENGLPYIDVRFQGTTTGGFHVAYFEIFLGTSVIGQDMVQSVYTKLVGGSTNNITNIVHRCEPSATTVKDDTPISLTDELVRTYETETAVNQDTNNSYGIALTFSSGVAIDITIRIAAPQIEIGTTPTPYQKVINPFWVEEDGVPAVLSAVSDGADDTMGLEVDGTGEANSTAYMMVKTTAPVGVLMSHSNAGWRGVWFENRADFLPAVHGDPSITVDGTPFNQEQRWQDVASALADGEWRFVKLPILNYMNTAGTISINGWAGYEWLGGSIGPVIVPDSEITPALEQAIEADMRAAAGLL